MSEANGARSCEHINCVSESGDTVPNDQPPNYSFLEGNSEHNMLPGRNGMDIHRRVSVSTQSDASSVDEQYEVRSIASSLNEILTWRGRLQAVLHSQAFHIVIVALVVLDAFIVLFEFLLDLGAFKTLHCFGEHEAQRQEFCHFDPNFRNMCGAPPHILLEGLEITPHGADSMRPSCTCAYRGGRRVCVPMQGEHIDEGVSPAYVLHILSVIILSIFLIEILLKLIAFRIKFFIYKFEVFDAIIVLISWLLDFVSLVQEETFEVATLLIVVRLWRILRVVNGSILTAKAKSDQQYKEAKNEMKRIIHAFHKARDLNATLEGKIEHLHKMVESTAGPPPDFNNRISVDSSDGMAADLSNGTSADLSNGIPVVDPGNEIADHDQAQPYELQDSSV